MKVAPGTIHAFLTAKKRRKPSSAQPKQQPTPPPVQPPLNLEREFAPPPPKLTPEQRKDALAKIREARRTYHEETNTTLPTFIHTDDPLIFESAPEQKKEK